MSFLDWIYSIVALFFVVTLVELLLPDKKGPVKQIISLIVLLTVLAPFLNLKGIVLALDVDQAPIEQNQAEVEQMFEQQLQTGVILQVRQLTAAVVLEQGGVEPSDIAVNLVKTDEGAYAVDEINIRVTNQLTGTVIQNITAALKQQTGCQKIIISKVG